MAINNKVLLHHLKEHFGNSIPIDLLPFVEKLNDVYNQNESSNNTNGELVKFKNKAKPTEDCEKLKTHNSLIQKASKTGSWEFDYPAHSIPGHNNSGDSHVSYFSDEVYRILGLEPG